MVDYLESLLDANERLNLTRVTDPRAAVRLHLVDSLIALPELHEAPTGVMLDLGSGGGFPGVPLALAAGRPAVLMDSVKKKTSAVTEVLLRTLPASQIVVVSERAEDHARLHAGEYSAVLARAVAPLAALLELASPLLRMGGVFVALKGVPQPEEMIAGEKVATMTGFGSLRVRRLVLPGGEERRTVVSAEKIGGATIRLPRRNGLAQRSPLA
jgi:16S rRNA (guanine527-N7)-methyltransferase